MAFKVHFVRLDNKTFPDSVQFRIAANGVLVITDGDDVIHYAPHAWESVTSQHPDYDVSDSIN